MTQKRSPLVGLARFFALIGGAIGAWVTYSSLFINHRMPIGSAIDADRKEFFGKKSCFLSYYADTRGSGRPLVLIHSINAAASAYEMRPLFEHYRGKRPVYALDLPGFGFSERSERAYTPDLYRAAILDFLEHLDSSEAPDVIALSLGSEFAALATHAAPQKVHTLTLISPTGLSHRTTEALDDQEGLEDIHHMLANPAWAQALYDLIATKLSIRFFLKMSFEGDVPVSLVDYAYLTAHQQGARHAPLRFLSGKLFSPSIFDQTYRTINTPTMVLYDKDMFAGFDRLEEILGLNPQWRVRRILNTRGLPHFERIDKVTEALDYFWSDAAKK